MPGMRPVNNITSKNKQKKSNDLPLRGPVSFGLRFRSYNFVSVKFHNHKIFKGLN